MNREHLQLCASAEWAALVRDELLPWVLEDSDLGADVLEIGAGPGLVTDLLLRLAPRVTAVEVDEALADGLRQRLAGQQIEVITADATELPLPSDRFSAAACFTMLHHIPDPAGQDRALAELARVCDRAGCCWGRTARTRLRGVRCTRTTSSCPSIRPGWPTGSVLPGSWMSWWRATVTASGSAVELGERVEEMRRTTRCRRGSRPAVCRWPRPRGGW